MKQEEFNSKFSELYSAYSSLTSPLHSNYQPLTLAQAQKAEQGLRKIKEDLEELSKVGLECCKSENFYNFSATVAAEHRTYFQRAEALRNGERQPYEQ